VSRFLALVRKAELALPETNIRLGRHEVDFLWREQRLIVEVDGFHFHSSAPRSSATGCATPNSALRGSG
jgi:very-short-patch-repair endonuclease